jgi:ATP-dependent Clp protease protease subunit
MTHQVSHGTHGNVQDTRIDQMEGEKYNYILFKILAENCGKTFEEMLEASRRDKWFNSDEALKFGLIDEVVQSEGTKSITQMLDGFDEYYKKEVMKNVL